MGGVMANDGDFNPGNWKWDGKTAWFMIAGAFAGAATGWLGAGAISAVAAAGGGIAAMTGVGIAMMTVGSLVQSSMMTILTAGHTPLFISLGPCSISFGVGSGFHFGYLGAPENTVFDNVMYFLTTVGVVFEINAIGSYYYNYKPQVSEPFDVHVVTDEDLPVVPERDWSPRLREVVQERKWEQELETLGRQAIEGMKPPQEVKTFGLSQPIKQGGIIEDIALEDGLECEVPEGTFEPGQSFLDPQNLDIYQDKARFTVTYETFDYLDAHGMAVQQIHEFDVPYQARRSIFKRLIYTSISGDWFTPLPMPQYPPFVPRPAVPQ
jgi:hypothetical protein